jgi:5-methylcytosine-specific restriction endonuclease McrA
LEAEERELTQINQRLQAKVDAFIREPYRRQSSETEKRELSQIQQRSQATIDAFQRERYGEPEPCYEPLPSGRPSARYRNAAPGERNTRRIPQAVIIEVADRDDGKCVYCGSRKDLHFDHIIPWSKGGANTVNNIQLLCGRCNRAKGAK